MKHFQILYHYPRNKEEEAVNTEVNIETITFPDGNESLKYVGGTNRDTYYPEYVFDRLDYTSPFFLIRFKGTSKDLYKLYQVKKLLENYIQSHPNKDNFKYVLYIPFFPNARMDKFVNNTPWVFNNECLIACEFINSLGFDKVIVLDPHSDVIINGLKNLHYINQGDIMSRVVYANNFNSSLGTTKQYDYLIIPDYGALKKVEAYYHKDYRKLERIQFLKSRNPETGTITSKPILEDKEYKGRALVVDDICDGGATFVAIAKSLSSLPNTQQLSLDLYTTFGLYSKGIQVLKDAGYNNIMNYMRV